MKIVAILGALLHRFYLYGYRGRVLPRLARRLLAGSALHRGWLAGHFGIYVEDGKQCGIIDNVWV